MLQDPVSNPQVLWYPCLVLKDKWAAPAFKVLKQTLLHGLLYPSFSYYSKNVHSGNKCTGRILGLLKKTLRHIHHTAAADPAGPD